MTNWRQRAWLTVLLAAAVAAGGCDRHGRGEKTAEEKTREAETAAPDKTGAAAAPRETPPPDKGPDPLITLRIAAPRLSAGDVEGLIVQPLETSLDGLKGLRSLRSLSQEGRAAVWAEFAAGTDADTAMRAVRDAAGRALDKLPKDADPPVLFRESFFNGFTVLALSAPRERSPAELRTVADDLVRPQLLSVPYVAKVAVLGGTVERCWILVSPQRLAAHGLTLADLTRAIEQANAAVEDGKPRTVATLAGADDVGQLIVAAREGQSVHVREVAKIDINGRRLPDDGPPLKLPADAPRAVFLAVSRLDYGNDTQFRRELDAAIAKISAALPPDVKLDHGVPALLAQAVPQLLERLQDGLPPGLRLQAETSEKWGTMLVPESPAPLTVKVCAPDREELHAIAHPLAADLRQVPGIADVAVAPAAAAEPELDIHMDRQKVLAMGVSLAEVTGTLEAVLGGRIVGQLRTAGGRRIDVVLACDERTPAELGDVLVATSKGQTVRLADAARIEAVAAPPPIYRENMLRAALVLCRVKGPPAAEAAADIHRVVKKAYESPRMLREGNMILFEP